MPGIDTAHNPGLRSAVELWHEIYPKVKNGQINDSELDEIFTRNKEIVFKWFPYIIVNCERFSCEDETTRIIKRAWCADCWFPDSDRYTY